jgi:hypothetical protein
VCGKPIEDIAMAFNDRENGQAMHFDCMLKRLEEREPLEAGDRICYIGGGRFGVVHFKSPKDNKHFTIKKILELEKTDERPEWRKLVADHFSIT